MEFDKVFEKVKEIIVEQLGKDEDEVTLQTSVKDDLDADSLDLYQIITEIEDEFGVQFDDPEAIETVEDVVKFVHENA
ncbi:MAG: acyl carrier protein [Lachnospiraceae bacterium]|nr:acyl carrier protein [Lachnospiraceae bacterium]